MPRQARLRIHGQGKIEVELLTAFLIALKRSYESVLVFEATIDGLNRAARDLPFPGYPFSLYFGWQAAPRRAAQQLRDWPPTAEQIASYVAPAEQLVVSAVRLSSPGFWEFLGTLNPLEVLRQYLNDRHDRRKDRDYRESAEQRRLLLENLSLENRVISERMRLAKDLGATNRDLAPLLNALVHRPLMALNLYQDRDVIRNTQILGYADDQEEEPEPRARS